MQLVSLRLTLLAASLAALALGLSSVAQAGPQAAAAAVRDANAIEAPLLARINAERRSHGLVPLRRSSALARAAAAHARAMGREGFFSHSSADGTSPGTRIRRYYRGTAVGETMLWRSPDATPAEALRMWLGSPSHRAILLNPDFREVGLGAVHAERSGAAFGGGEVTIVVADFGVRAR
jgi:uncharacterized protein YkwD